MHVHELQVLLERCWVDKEGKQLKEMYINLKQNSTTDHIYALVNGMGSLL